MANNKKEKVAFQLTRPDAETPVADASDIDLNGKPLNDVVPECVNSLGADLEIADENEEVLAEFKDGHFRTRDFDSRKTPKQESSENAQFEITDENGNAIADFKDGHFRTQRFDSRSAASINEDSSKGTAVFNITDKNGNILVQFKNGHIKTKNFDSSNIKTNSGSDIINGYTTIKSNMKILCLGNSWARDTVRLLWATANDAGVKDLTVCQAYQGGNSLYNMLKGMDDNNLTYTHGSYEQYVHGTYQLWKYTSASPVKTPSDTKYANGKCGVNDGVAYGKNADQSWAGKTLQEILSMEDWDIILIRLATSSDLIMPEMLAEDNDEFGAFDILTFLNRIKQELTDECLEKVEFGISSTWTYPEGCTKNFTTPSFLRFAGTVLGRSVSDWSSLQPTERNEVFRASYQASQENFQRVALRMGNECIYMVNTAKAIEYARNSVMLGNVGFGLCKSAGDTHLAEGIPKYLCACCICYEMLGIQPADFMCEYIPKGSADAGTDGGNESTVPTQAQCVAARKIAYAASYCDDYQINV